MPSSAALLAVKGVNSPLEHFSGAAFIRFYPVESGFKEIACRFFEQLFLL